MLKWLSLPLKHLASFLRHLAEGPKEVPVKEVPSVHLSIGTPKYLKGIQPAAGQRHQLPLHEPVQVLQGHPGDAVLVDHHTGAEGLHGVGHVGGE